MIKARNSKKIAKTLLSEGWREKVRFGLVSLFNGISTFVGYLMSQSLS